MIVDEVQITVKAGDGSDGHVSFRREKYVPRGGPDGGDGGDGGNVYVIGISDLTALRQFRYKKEIQAQDGGKGRNKKRHGKNGAHLIVNVPIGTTIIDLQTKKSWEISKVNQKELIVKGGKGGRGNFELRSNQNKAPMEAEKGTSGEEKELLLTLSFIAHIGLIGLPNAGKSSLLNVLTKANIKVASYPFTTLEPNLGSMNGKIIADIPGLIEGAHKGRGLGIKFLKHIEKTKLLVHCIDSTDENVLEKYKIIRQELKEFSQKLLNKKEIVLLTKSDLTQPQIIKQKTSQLKKVVQTISSSSIIDDKSLESLKKLLLKHL